MLFRSENGTLRERTSRVVQCVPSAGAGRWFDSWLGCRGQELCRRLRSVCTSASRRCACRADKVPLICSPQPGPEPGCQSQAETSLQARSAWEQRPDDNTLAGDSSQGSGLLAFRVAPWPGFDRGWHSTVYSSLKPCAKRLLGLRVGPRLACQGLAAGSEGGLKV